jgi:hypothetical protein
LLVSEQPQLLRKQKQRQITRSFQPPALIF